MTYKPRSVYEKYANTDAVFADGFNRSELPANESLENRGSAGSSFLESLRGDVAPSRTQYVTAFDHVQPDHAAGFRKKAAEIREKRASVFHAQEAKAPKEKRSTGDSIFHPDSDIARKNAEIIAAREQAAAKPTEAQMVEYINAIVDKHRAGEQLDADAAEFVAAYEAEHGALRRFKLAGA